MDMVHCDTFPLETMKLHHLQSRGMVPLLPPLDPGGAAMSAPFTGRLGGHPTLTNDIGYSQHFPLSPGPLSGLLCCAGTLEYPLPVATASPSHGPAGPGPFFPAVCGISVEMGCVGLLSPTQDYSPH